MYKAPWAPSGFEVSLSLVEYGVKNFKTFKESPVMKARPTTITAYILAIHPSVAEWIQPFRSPFSDSS